MSDTSKSLRKAADEIENEGHLGWGNTCRWAADEFDALRSRLAEAEALLREARGDYEKDLMAVGHAPNETEPARTQAMDYLRKRIADINAFLAKLEAKP